MPNPVTAEVFIEINGKRSDALASVTIVDPNLADFEVAALLRKLADEISAQAFHRPAANLPLED